MSAEKEGHGAPPPYTDQQVGYPPLPQQGYPPAQGYPAQPPPPGYGAPPIQGQPPMMGQVPPTGYYPVPAGQPTGPGVAYGYSQPGTVIVQSTATGPVPDNHMCLAIFTTLCCFWPLGIVAIIKSSEVNSKWSAGDGQGARHASAQSRQFSMIAIGIGVAAYIICAIIIGVYIGILSQYWH